MIKAGNYKISENPKKWNKLVDWHWNGGWIKSSYDWQCHAWREMQMGWGWNRFGARKYPDGLPVDELSGYLESLENCSWSPNDFGAVELLERYGIITETGL